MARGELNEPLRSAVAAAERAGRRGSRLWRAAAIALSLPRRRRIAVNVGRIARLTSGNEVVLVPGRVLGGGEIHHPVTVSSLYVTPSARAKILRAGGRHLSIEGLVGENPKGSGVEMLR